MSCVYSFPFGSPSMGWIVHINGKSKKPGEKLSPKIGLHKIVCSRKMNWRIIKEIFYIHYMSICVSWNRFSFCFSFSLLSLAPDSGSSLVEISHGLWIYALRIIREKENKEHKRANERIKKNTNRILAWWSVAFQSHLILQTTHEQTFTIALSLTHLPPLEMCATCVTSEQ